MGEFTVSASVNNVPKPISLSETLQDFNQEFQEDPNSIIASIVEMLSTYPEYFTHLCVSQEGRKQERFQALTTAFLPCYYDEEQLKNADLAQLAGYQQSVAQSLRDMILGTKEFKLEILSLGNTQQLEATLKRANSKELTAIKMVIKGITRFAPRGWESANQEIITEAARQNRIEIYQAYCLEKEKLTQVLGVENATQAIIELYTLKDALWRHYFQYSSCARRMEAEAKGIIQNKVVEHGNKYKHEIETHAPANASQWAVNILILTAMILPFGIPGLIYLAYKSCQPKADGHAALRKEAQQKNAAHIHSLPAKGVTNQTIGARLFCPELKLSKQEKQLLEATSKLALQPESKITLNIKKPQGCRGS